MAAPAGSGRRRTAQNAATVAGAALGAALGQRAGLPLTLNGANLGVVAASCAAARLLPSRTGGGDGAGER